MRRLTLLALAVLVGGVALLGYSVATGESQVHLVLIFPVITGSGLIAFAGILLVAVGMFLGFFSIAQSSFVTPEAPPPSPSAPGPRAPPPAAPAKRFGGVVFLGPVPIVFGSDVRVSRAMLVLAIALTVLLLVFFFLVLNARP